MLSKFERALKIYSELFNNAPQKKKHKYLYPIKRAEISYSAALKLGFKATKYMWKGCMYTAARNKGKNFSLFHSFGLSALFSRHV
jgi:hypothetical protein